MAIENMNISILCKKQMVGVWKLCDINFLRVKTYFGVD